MSFPNSIGFPVYATYVDDDKRDKQRKRQFIGGKPVYSYKMHPQKRTKSSLTRKWLTLFGVSLPCYWGMSYRKIAVTLNEEGVPSYNHREVAIKYYRRGSES